MSRHAGRRPSELLGDLGSEALALDFDLAVASHLYLFEHRRDTEERFELAKAQAKLTAFELAKFLAPLFGGEVEDGDSRPWRHTCEHAKYRNLPDGSLQCLDCGEIGN